MQNIIAEIQKRCPDLRKAEIEGILHILISGENLTNSELVRLTGIPRTILKDFKTAISPLLLSHASDEISLTEKGTAVINELNPRPYAWSLVNYEDKALEQKLCEIRKKYFLSPNRDYDQFFATEQSSIAKARLLITKGMVENKTIVLLGDDDLVSVTLGLMDAGYYKIKVFDIDDRILNVIKQISSDYALGNIETQIHDVRKDFPKEELGKYDVVITDPPYTKSGISLFLARAVDLLKKFDNYQGRYILLNFGAGLKNPEKETKIQEIINQTGLLIEDKLSKFTRYYGAETVGSSSSMYVLKTTPFTVANPIIYRKQIYTFEEGPEEKFPFVDHYVFKANKIPLSIVDSKKALMKIAGDFCRHHNLKVVDTKVTKFRGKGLTLTYILSTSNLLLHTWPELNALHIDLITCSPIYRKEDMGRTWADLLATQYIEVTRIE